MFWLVLFLGFGVIGLVSLAIAVSSVAPNERATGGAVAVAALLANIVVTIIFSMHIVDAKHVGVVRSFGGITGQIGEGFQFTWPWQRVEEWNIRLQFVEPDTSCSNGTPKCMDAGSIDIQDIYIEGQLNLEVDIRDVQNLSRNIGKSYIDTVVRSRWYQVLKKTTAKYRASDILAVREEIRAQVREDMKAELAPYSISVSDFLITNIDFTDAFRAQIDNKTRAEQEALTEQNKVAVEEAKARQAAAVAFGEAERLRITAQGQADANRIVSQSLTPQLIQFQAIQKFTDKVQIMLIPSGTGLIFDPASLLATPR